MLASRLAALDHVRRSPRLFGGPPGHKEWLHLCVRRGPLTLLVNFSLVDTPQAAGKWREAARVVALVHEGEWYGEVLTVDPKEVRVASGRVDLQFGIQFMRLVRDELCVHCDLPGGLAIDLRCVPQATPILLRPAEGGPPVHWVAVPRLLASGVVTAGGKTWNLNEVPAYHDHNWGPWQWGDSFAWQWAYALPAARNQLWHALFLRMQDGGRGQTTAQALSIWRDGVERRVFRDGELRVWGEGQAPGEWWPKFPSVLALVLDEATGDVPARLCVEARWRDDYVKGAFSIHSVAVLGVPRDTDLGVTRIHECAATLCLDGQISGEPLHMEAESVVEFLVP